MKVEKFSRLFRIVPIGILLLTGGIGQGFGQSNALINLSAIDGIPLTPDNIFNYQVQVQKTERVKIVGAVKFRGSQLSLGYTFQATLRAGFNRVADEVSGVEWDFSVPALRRLFMDYKTLPEGTYEYCVSVTPVVPTRESQGTAEDCLYYTTQDRFVINLIDPDDKSKLKEHNPDFSWVANYSFSGELTYRLRIAGIQSGQSPVSAVLRNQPIFDEIGLPTTYLVYPYSARPLSTNQPYAWMVDAYFNGILLGGSDTWQFVIPDDTLKPLKPVNRSYLDIKRENGTAKILVEENLKLKYFLDMRKEDELQLELLGPGGSQEKLAPTKLTAKYGDNRYIINLTDSCHLMNHTDYQLRIHNLDGDVFTVPFTYSEIKIEQ